MTKQYMYTERAHLMCPNMCFGIVEIVKAPYDAEKMKQTITSLENAHPFLKAILGYEEENNQYFYDVTDNGKVKWIDIEESVDSINDPRVMKEYKKIVGYDWNLFTEGMLKIVTWKTNGPFCVLFVFHHLLVDGRGGLGLAQEFADLYVDEKEPARVEECLITNVKDLPDGAELRGISKWLIRRYNKKWIKENHILSYESYHNFANDYVKKITYAIRLHIAVRKN